MTGSSGTARTAVICDDDPLVRSVARRIVEDVGFEVLAECEDLPGAIDSMHRSDVDVVILDLALRGGHGEELLSHLRDDGIGARVVVFSAYVADASLLLARGAQAVVEKPDFAGLEDALHALADDRPAVTHDHRRPSPRPLTPLPPPTGLTISRFEPWPSFLAVVDALASGDALLVVDVVPEPSQRAAWDDVYRLDHRVAIGRAAVSVRRAEERVSIAPEGPPVLALIGGHPEAPAAVFDRLERTWKREVGSGVPVGAFGHVTERTPAATVLRRALSLVGDDVSALDQPLRMV